MEKIRTTHTGELSLDDRSEELHLDPKDWSAMQQLGYRIVDDMIAYLKSVAERPAWSPVSQEAKTALSADLPWQPQSPFEVYEECKKFILPYPTGNIHPRFWGWVKGTGNIMGAYAEMIAAVMNSNVSLGDQSALYVEKQVIGWCKQIMNFPDDASGLLVSGGSMANFLAIVVARNVQTGHPVRKEGLHAVGSQLRLYCSTETHSCITKAAESAGLGNIAVRKIPVDDDFRIRTDLLEAAIQEDQKAGDLPFCIVGNAGTVNSGAIDPLEELRAISNKHGMWFHIDGAFGALAKLLPEYDDALQGINNCDSLAFDLHKWMYMPYEVGCVLIRDAKAQKGSFAYTPDYLMKHERGFSAGPETLGNYGIELSRGFKALKVWMSVKEHGMEKYAQLIRQNIQQARYLEQLIEEHAELELLAPVSLNIVCFRYYKKGLSNEELNVINKEILMDIQTAGIAVPSSTVINGCYAIRVAICNHRSTRADFDLLVDAVIAKAALRAV
jgi:aromatic-L-amino-acid decarboxylase